MEWDLKMPPWDFAELERDSDPSVGPVVVTRSVGGGGPAPPVNRVDCSVDLKLGGFGDLGPVKSRWPRPQQQQSQSQPQPPPPLTSVMPSSGTLKRPRALSSGTQSASCLVDGCDADLSKCREYHRRHKVCELHSKTPAVMVGGREQRFCQQCSRFHLLVEFDEVKRSCRKRLDGHNRRRRKPQPNSLNSVNLFPNHQGSMFSVSSQLFPVSAPEQSWAGIKSDILYQHSTSPQFTERELCFGNSYIFNKEGKQIPFLQKRDTALTNRNMLGTFQTPLTTISLSGSNSNGSNEMSSHGVTPVFRSNSALSLLSSPTPTSSINISYLVPPCPADQIPMGQPIVSNLQHTDAVHHSPPAASECLSSTGFPCPVMEDGAIFVSGDNASNTRCQSIFHAGVEGSSDGTLQMLPFSWN